MRPPGELREQRLGGGAGSDEVERLSVVVEFVPARVEADGSPDRHGVQLAEHRAQLFGAPQATGDAAVTDDRDRLRLPLVDEPVDGVPERAW